MSIFDKVKIRLPRRTAFPLSEKASFDCDIGQMIPFFARMTYPGDFWFLRPEAVINFAPMVAPITTPVTCYFEFWFCSARNLFELDHEQGSWQNLISGGKEGKDDQLIDLDLTADEKAAGKVTYPFRSIEDYSGIAPGGVEIHANDAPNNFLVKAVNWTWNEFYRDQDLQDERDLFNREVPLHNWRRDYFMSARPFRQRGQSPAFPLGGFAPLSSKLNEYRPSDLNDYIDMVNLTTKKRHSTSPSNASIVGLQFHNKNENDTTFYYHQNAGIADNVLAAHIDSATQSDVEIPFDGRYTLGVDGTQLVSFDMAEFRRVRDVQKFMELNARAGVRYVEFLSAHYGVSPSDSTLQRPQFIGGTKENIVISQVIQNSETNTTPQGNLAGKGMLLHSSQRRLKFFCKEIGLIFGFMYMLPETQYQQGIPREWSSRSRWDFMFPEFQHLSEQAVKQKEIFVGTNTAENNKTFGYQGIYNELRTSRSHVAGAMRSNYPQSLDYWHMAFDFANSPNLNASLLECRPPKRIFAVPSEPGCLCEVGVNIKAVRPLARYAIPY